MTFLKKPQLIALGAAVLLIVLLLLLPRVEKPKEEVSETEIVPEKTDVDAASLNADDQASLDALIALIEQTGDPIEKIDLYDSLSRFWEVRGDVYRSAEALSEVAHIIGDKPSYFIAGDKYFEAFQKSEGSERKAAIEKAIHSYEKVLEDNPEDLEAMTSLGVCYVEGAQLTGEAPMKGIGMLQRVLELDPENINAMVNLGYFAIQSGQYEKAEARFLKVLEIDPEFLDAYLYLSDLYLKSGEREKAIAQLEVYRDFIQDPQMVQQLNDYIDKIRSNNI